MKTASDYLDAIRARHGLDSDRKAALLLGLSQSAMVRYRHGHDAFSDETARRVAELLDLDPEEVFIAANAQRAKDEQSRAVWESLMKRAGYAAGVILIAAGTAGAPAPAQASANCPAGTLCIMSTRRSCRRCPMARPVTSWDALPLRLAA